MTWHISDTHFNHTNIIKYCDRPFNDVREMNEFIINEWNKVIEKNDIVYHHGDFASNLTSEEVENIVDRLNGKIILIYGNHERKGVGFFEKCGFFEVHKKKIIIGNYILSHKPQDVSQIPDGFINIHGHIHNHKLGLILKSENDIHKYINVSCEAVGYKPIWINIPPFS